MNHQKLSTIDVVHSEAIYSFWYPYRKNFKISMTFNTIPPPPKKKKKKEREV